MKLAKSPVASESVADERICLTLRPKARINVIPDKRITERQALVDRVHQYLGMMGYLHYGIGFSRLIATEVGTAHILRSIAEAEKEHILAHLSERYFNHDRWKIIDTALKKIEWIDQSLAVIPEKSTEEIIMAEAKTPNLIDAAAARNLLVKAKRVFDTTSDTPVLMNAALIVALAQDSNHPGVAVATKIINAVAVAPQTGVLDEITEILDKLASLEETSKKS